MNRRESVYLALVIQALQSVRVKGILADAVPYGDKAAVRYGPMTHEVAMADGQTAAIARYHLKRLHAQGYVLMCPCAGGTTRWWPAGFADDLKAHQVVEDGVTYFMSPPVRPVA